MNTGFWHRKWEQNEIAFHESEANPLLAEHFNKLSLAKGSRVFLPLCGKTRDVSWLLTHGYRVTGAELSKIAVHQLFVELGVRPAITTIGEADHYSAPGSDIFVGNVFDLSSTMLGSVDAVYDRAALVALPKNMRHRYTAHVAGLTGKAPQLLICYEYDQSLMEGPPFSVSAEEVKEHYKDRYDLTLLASTNVPGGLKGRCAAQENVWLLRRG